MTSQPLTDDVPAGRRHDLDWVRIGAFALLIFYHVGMYYVTWDWHVKSPAASTTLEPLMMLSAPWRLSLLFLISGVASAYLLNRLGTGAMVRQRSLRLLVPLAFGMAVIVPPQSYLEVVEKLGYADGYGEFLKLYARGYGGFCRGTDCLTLPTWNHLWFVAYLWVYTILLCALVAAMPSAIPRLRALAERGLAGWGLLVWPAALLALVRVALVARYGSTHALIGDWYNHASYAPVFVAGFVLAGTRAPWATFEQARWHALALATVAWAFLCAYFATYSDDAAPPPHALQVFQRCVYGAQQWLPIVAVLGFAGRHLRHDGPARRYLTSAIFPVYILHQTVIVVLAHALKPARLAPGVEGLLLVVTTFALCFLGYEAVRRVAVLRPLFGLAPGRHRPSPVAAPACRLAPQDTN